MQFKIFRQAGRKNFYVFFYPNYTYPFDFYFFFLFLAKKIFHIKNIYY